MSKPLLCPVCGEEMENMDHYDGEEFYSCSNGGCAMRNCLVSEFELETRPVETALRAKIAELEAENNQKNQHITDLQLDMDKLSRALEKLLDACDWANENEDDGAATYRGDLLNDTREILYSVIGEPGGDDEGGEEEL